MNDIPDNSVSGAFAQNYSAIEWAKAYPFDVPGRSYVYCRGEAHFLDDFTLQNWRSARINRAGSSAVLSDVLDTAELAALEQPRHAVVACGSNAAPRRLAQKFRHVHDVVPTLRVTLENYCIVYSAKFSAYGSIPATLVRVPGACVTTFVNLLTDQQLRVMDETETLGVAYDRPVLEDATVRGMDGAPPHDGFSPLSAYVSRSGALCIEGVALALDTVEGSAVPFQKYSQEKVQSLVKDLLNAGDSVDNFIEQNLNDPVLRNDRAAKLQRNWAVRYDVPLPVNPRVRR